MPDNHTVRFTFGGTLFEPTKERDVPSRALAQEPKWTRFPASEIRTREAVPTVSDFFQIKRGLATGDNDYFILPADEIIARELPMDAFIPILPGPRYLSEDEIKADKDGNPKIERRLFLLDTKLPEDEIRRRFPALHAYLEEGKACGLHERYLCRHRSPWYSQENRPPPPIVCTHLGRGNTKRGRPFRFILNASRATVANVYLAMYPTSLLASAMKRDASLIRRVWQLFNELAPDQILGEGRVYGGGLLLANVPVPGIAALLPHNERPAKQANLLNVAWTRD